MKKFDFAIVKNPDIVQENCLPVHSDHVCMPNWFEGEENSFRMSLDGLWKYSYAKNMGLAVADFEEEAYCCKEWDEIRVPSNISMEHNAVASYVKYFTLPVNMRGERVCISFQGAGNAFAVWLNGQYIGYHRNLIQPAEFELTQYLKEGENKLAVRVWKTDSSYEEENCASFSGIFRSVFLYMVPRTHLWNVEVLPELSEDLTEGTLTIITTSCGRGEVEIRLFDNAMQEVLAGVMVLEEGEEDSDEIQSGIAGMVYEPKLWSSEIPNLYMLQLEVRDENGDLTEVISMQVGFRHVETQEGRMTLNGKPCCFKGVKHPSVCVDGMHLLHGEELEQLLVMMKQNNINAIQLGNDPYVSELYELCDIYGLHLVADHSIDLNGKKNHPSICYGTVCEASPNMQKVKFNYQNISIAFTEKTFTVWNKHSFRNTDEFEAAVILKKDGIDIAKVALPIAVEPLEKKCFDIPHQILGIMDNFKIASAVQEGEPPEFAIIVSFALREDTIWGKRGHEVAFGQYIYKKEVTPYTGNEPIEVVREQNRILVKGCHFKALFSEERAGLVSYIYGGVELLKSIPLPNFWCVPAEKDVRTKMQQGYAQWKIASMYVSMDTLVVEELENSVKLTYTYAMPTSPKSSCQVCYHVFGDGTIETTMVYEPVDGLVDMPEFGMIFKLDATYDNLTWYGLGPDETDLDGMCGGKLGVYESKVADIMSKCQTPQDCGNKCGVRFAEIKDAQGRGMRFFGDELSFRALPYTPHEIENAEHMSELPAVHNTVVRIAKQEFSEKKVFTFCFRGV